MNGTNAAKAARAKRHKRNQLAAAMREGTQLAAKVAPIVEEMKASRGS